MNMKIREITKRQFDAYCYVRAPLLRYMATEIAWFEAFDKKLMATVTRDHSDEDYGFVILGRDKQKVFRAIDFCRKFYTTPEEAISYLKIALIPYENDGKEIYEQGDEKALPNEILIPQVPAEKLHAYFKIMIEQQGYEAARNLIKEIVYSYVDVDGNYIKDFQTTGFDARLWELYLHVYLHTAGFKIDNSYQAPDYFISYFGDQLAIEAVTVNRSSTFDEPAPKGALEVLKLNRDYMPIKFGSALYTKLQKKYWVKDHIKGKPFILAIHDFHMPATMDSLGSMTWSRDALADYLYGYRMKITINDDGDIVRHIHDNGHGVEPVMEKIESHTWKSKTIPSNFFGLPDAENISAVLFTNNATLTTFNRMGKLAGLGNKDIKMLRIVSMYDPDPYATEPIRKVFDLDDPDYEEAWADGLIMYHNPDAKFPVEPALFSDISHMFFDKKDKVLHGRMQPYDVFSSMTQVLIPKANIHA
ncbi:hypothetical protein [Terrimonas pollutisoli]|uniref:hypothetical protein n=1 Tax=Terrimonas pollutisoli TaxID=3034147 RepID=UPI0023ECA11F|nr:hypothetical protein [Terrimonas sp. H1YJ31]